MSLYAYTSATGNRKVLDSSNLDFTGIWNGSTAYDPRDVADDGLSHHWIALVANTNVPLPTIFDTTIYATWSHLVALEPPVLPAVSVVPGDWLPDVWNGTNYAGTLFGEAFALAQAGTDAGAAAYSLANAAYVLAQAGTNQPAIDNVYSIAVTALDTAWTGTTAADQAYSLTLQALSAAWDGTNAASAANQVASEAFALAAAGTTKSFAGPDVFFGVGDFSISHDFGRIPALVRAVLHCTSYDVGAGMFEGEEIGIEGVLDASTGQPLMAVFTSSGTFRVQNETQGLESLTRIGTAEAGGTPTSGSNFKFLIYAHL